MASVHSIDTCGTWIGAWTVGHVGCKACLRPLAGFHQNFESSPGTRVRDRYCNIATRRRHRYAVYVCWYWRKSKWPVHRNVVSQRYTISIQLERNNNCTCDATSSSSPAVAAVRLRDCGGTGTAPPVSDNQPTADPMRFTSNSPKAKRLDPWTQE